MITYLDDINKIERLLPSRNFDRGLVGFDVGNEKDHPDGDEQAEATHNPEGGLEPTGFVEKGSQSRPQHVSQSEEHFRP